MQLTAKGVKVGRRSPLYWGESSTPKHTDIRAFRIPPDQFIALAHGTWHAGPYFSEPRRDFYNLELIDTNKADYTVCHVPAPLTFAA